MKLDIILWDDPRVKTVIASPVSPEGAVALATVFVNEHEMPEGVTPEHMIGCFPVQMEPRELMSHLGTELSVVFYNRVLGVIINVADMIKNPLQ